MKSALFSISFTEALAIVFIILKLTGVIAWSWWWVLSPIWIPIAIVLGIIVLVLIGLGFMALCAALFGR
jgi:hypothetical protein